MLTKMIIAANASNTMSDKLLIPAMSENVRNIIIVLMNPNENRIRVSIILSNNDIDIAFLSVSFVLFFRSNVFIRSPDFPGVTNPNAFPMRNVSTDCFRLYFLLNMFTIICHLYALASISGTKLSTTMDNNNKSEFFITDHNFVRSIFVSTSTNRIIPIIDKYFIENFISTT